MSEDKKTHTCFTCGQNFQFEKHNYDGKWIPTYQIEVCRSCWQFSWDGWTGDRAEKIEKHLKEEGIPVPERDENGRLPRG